MCMRTEMFRTWGLAPWMLNSWWWLILNPCRRDCRSMPLHYSLPRRQPMGEKRSWRAVLFLSSPCWTCPAMKGSTVDTGQERPGKMGVRDQGVFILQKQVHSCRSKERREGKPQSSLSQELSCYWSGKCRILPGLFFSLWNHPKSSECCCVWLLQGEEPCCLIFVKSGQWYISVCYLTSISLSLNVVHDSDKGIRLWLWHEENPFLSGHVCSFSLAVSWANWVSLKFFMGAYITIGLQKVLMN